MNVSYSDCNETNGSVAGVCPWIAQYQSRHSAIIQRWKLNGFFEDDDFLEINCHWLQFEPASLVNHLVLVCIFIVILLVGCFCNALTVYILVSSRHLRTPANIVIINLAVSDFLMLFKMPIFLYNSLLQGPAFGMRGCKIYGFLSGLTGTTSIMSLAAVAFDRFLVISHPLNIDKKPTRARAYATITFIWLYSALFAALPFFGIGKYVPEGYLTSCSFDYLSDDITTRIFILTFFVAAWVVPFLIIIYCYVAIVWYVHKAKKELGRQQVDGSILRNCIGSSTPGWRQCAVEVVIAKIVVRLVALWLISWTPYACVALMGISGNEHKLTADMTMLPALFAKFSACVNPIVYTLSHPKIKKEILRRWYSTMNSGSRNKEQGAANEGSVNGGYVMRQGPAWRQGSAIERSKSNTGSASPIEKRKNRANIIVNQMNQAEESILSQDRDRDQLGHASIHLRSHKTRVDANTDFLNRKFVGETNMPNVTSLIVTADINDVRVAIDAELIPQISTYAANNQSQQNEESAGLSNAIYSALTLP